MLLADAHRLRFARTTMIFRREGDSWTVVHAHARIAVDGTSNQRPPLVHVLREHGRELNLDVIDVFPSAGTSITVTWAIFEPVEIELGPVVGQHQG